MISNWYAGISEDIHIVCMLWSNWSRDSNGIISLPPRDMQQLGEWLERERRLIIKMCRRHANCPCKQGASIILRYLISLKLCHENSVRTKQPVPAACSFDVSSHKLPLFSWHCAQSCWGERAYSIYATWESNAEPPLLILYVIFSAQQIHHDVLMSQVWDCRLWWWVRGLEMK